MLIRFWLTLLALLPVSALAQPVVSPRPDSVSVTIYRAPDRNVRVPINMMWLYGYALVTEKRTVRIPKGRAVIRFEGVAAGILPESAIVTGLPDGVREKNLDADVLTPYSLYARSFGRPITLRRTLKDGSFREERAIIRSGPDGAAILQTKDGFEAARCEGSDSIVYDKVPEGLTPKPTLSVETEAAGEGQVTVTLSYLAWGFDWQANYVATMRPDGRTADLFAWVTLASTDVTSFPDAETMVVAGKIEREDDAYGRSFRPDTAFLFRCLSTPLPDDGEIVDGVMAQDVGAFPDTNIAEALQRVPGVAMSRKAVAVIAEDFGDLKLYRVPSRTTVAAMSQKQVSLLDKPSVPVEIYYRTSLWDDEISEDVTLTIRAQNRKEKGLGLALPGGPVAVFAPHDGESLLVGEGAIGDKAVGEEVEVGIAPATQVTARLDSATAGKGTRDFVLTVTNANPWPVQFEAGLNVGDQFRRTRLSAKPVRKPGGEYWVTRVPANGEATLRFRLQERR